MTEPSASAQPASAADSAPAYLAVNNMHAHYGESYIVQGISLAVNEGEILALLGRNGAGKTTTLRTIARLDDPQLTKGNYGLTVPGLTGCPAIRPPLQALVWYQKTAASSPV
jgi:branched-chain amino acid transport system ATP-binding protein